MNTPYDSTEQITQEVLRRFEETPDPRLRQIMLSLVQHLHAFAKDVKLTSEEWLKAMQLLEETGKWCAPGRHEFKKFYDALGLSMLTVKQEYPP
ncbi:MAG: dioxygenase, partial [Betaproteobacteria bacterium]